MQDPIGVFNRIREFVISYTETAFRIRRDDPTHQSLSDTRSELLRQAGILCAEPLIEPILRYIACQRSDADDSGWNIEELIETELGERWLPGFDARERLAAAKLILGGLFPSDPDNGPVGRKAKFPMYDHQARMMRRGVSAGQPGIVTSGTGSGKTESFLLPILARIAAEAKSWPSPADGYLQNAWWMDNGLPIPNKTRLPDWPTAGRRPYGEPFSQGIHRAGESDGRPQAVRALIIYPMNALVEDQLVRLRKSLDSRESRTAMEQEFNGNRIFFGRYTSATPVTSFPMKPGDRRLLDDNQGASDEEKRERTRVTNRRQRKYASLLEDLTEYFNTQNEVRQMAGYGSDEIPEANPTTRNEHSDSPFQFPAVNGGELLTRWDMQETPPDILITNVSMLNGILTREVDSPIIQKTRDWITNNDDAYFYLVLDELHLHRGSAGSELSGLLRVLLHRLGLLDPAHKHKLRILCSSASLPAVGEKGIKSCEYLYDLFGRNGHWKAGQDEPDTDISIWENSIEKGEQVKPENSAGCLNTEAFEELFESCQNQDLDLPASLDFPINDIQFEALSRVSNEFGIETDQERGDVWIGRLVEFASNVLASSCNNEGVFRATRASRISEQIFGDSQNLNALRGLTILRGIGDVASISDAMGTVSTQLPAFRVHTFLRSMEGLFASFRPVEDQLAVSRLAVERAWDFSDDDNSQRRVFELLYCECCGDVFLGGKRSGTQNTIELVPVDPDIDGIPETANAHRVEDLSYEEFKLVWPRFGKLDSEPAIGNRPTDGDPGTWVPRFLDTVTGQLRLTRSGVRQQHPLPDEIYVLLFERAHNGRNRTDKTGRGDNERGTSVPYACPACGTDYLPRFRRPELRQSPIRTFRPGFAKTTQLMATELFSAQRLSDGDETKLISFSDSRQDAARTDMDIQDGHFQDLLREIVIKTILVEHNQSATANSSLTQEVAELRDKQNRAKEEGNFEGYAAFGNQITSKEIELGQAAEIGVPLNTLVEQYQFNGEFPYCKMQDDIGVEQPRLLFQRLAQLGVHPTHGAGTAKFPRSRGLKFNWYQLIKSFKDGTSWIDYADHQNRIVEARLELVEALHRQINSLLFSRTYFSLEECGIGYPIANGVEPQSSDRMAAVMRILADLYRVDMDYFRSSDQVEPWHDMESMWGGRKIKDLMSRLASHLDNENAQKAWFWDLVSELANYGHRGGKIIQQNIRIKVVEPNDPFWRCTNCGRVHLHIGLSVCTRCGETLEQPTGEAKELRRSNFLARRAFREEPSFRLATAELTGQTQNPADRQRRFREVFVGSQEMTPEAGIERKLRDGIDLLAVTTTMEVGIDIGSLRAVLEGNMSPQRFNYQQRVGRAGRRGQGFAYALTVCKSRSHDLHYFRHPEAITGDEPPPPFLTSTQPEIPARLLNKFWLVDAFERMRIADRSTPDGWVGDQIAKPDFHGEFINRIQWQSDEQDWNDRLRDQLNTVAGQLALTGLREALVNDCRSPEVGQQIAANVTTESLLAAISDSLKKTPVDGLGESLAENGIFPMFGMPTRTRTLYTYFDYDEGPDGDWETMDRDLDMAIFEFEPGNVLVRDKWQIMCTGLTPTLVSPYYRADQGEFCCQFDDESIVDQTRLFQCRECGAWNRIEHDDELVEEIECRYCNNFSPSEEVQLAITPAAFRSSLRKIPSDERIELRQRSPRIANALASDDTLQPLPKTTCCFCASNAQTFTLNQGPSRQGFEFVAAETNIKDRLSITGQMIQGDLVTQRDSILDPQAMSCWLIAQKYTRSVSLVPTNVDSRLQIDRMPLMSSGTVDWQAARWAGVRAAALSAGFLIVNRVAYEMDIDPEELEVIEPYRQLVGQEGASLPVLRIAERAANGAGYTEKLVIPNDNSLLASSIRSLLEDPDDPIGQSLREEEHLSDCSKACYRCLMRYGNQSWHGILDWRLGMDWIRLLMGNLEHQPTALGTDSNEWGFWSADWANKGKQLAFNLSIRIGNNESTPIGLCDDFLWAFQLRGKRSQSGPWILIVHPLWSERGGPNSIVSQAIDELRNNPSVESDILVADYFNLSRRPNKVREWLLNEANGS